MVTIIIVVLCSIVGSITVYHLLKLTDPKDVSKANTVPELEAMYREFENNIHQRIRERKRKGY